MVGASMDYAGIHNLLQSDNYNYNYNYNYN
jgi:hypothetical protein